MFQAEESVEKIDFNVGKVLVTSAEVRVADAIGYSMVMDTDEQKALNSSLKQPYSLHLFLVFRCRRPTLRSPDGIFLFQGGDLHLG